MEKISEKEVKLSYDEIIDLYGFLTKIGGGKKDKFSLCMGLLSKQFDKKMKKMNKDIDDIDIDLASTDASGDVKVNANGSYCFTKENTKARMTKIDEIKNKQVVINVTKTPDLRRVKTLPVNILLAFDGILYDLNDKFWEEDEATAKAETTKAETTASANGEENAEATSDKKLETSEA